MRAPRTEDRRHVAKRVPPFLSRKRGCASRNQATCSAYIGAAGTFTLFAVTVTDAYQLTASGALNVNACPPPGTAARMGYPTGLYLASFGTYCAAGGAPARPPGVRGG